MTSTSLLYIFLLLNILHQEPVSCCEETGPLGMITGDIQDWQITASSSYPAQWDRGCSERYARVYQPAGYAWCAKYRSPSEWLQINLGVPANITGFMVQGRGHGKEWVSSFKVSHAVNPGDWDYIVDPSNLAHRLFEGPSNAYEVRHYYLDKPILATYIRFHVLTWNKHPTMRVEILGCQECRKLIGLPPFGKLTASSSTTFRRGTSCKPEDGHIYSNQAWCAKRGNAQQWLQIDIGPPTQINGVVTKGRGDTRKKQWVKRYKLTYANFTEDFSKNTAKWYMDDFGINPEIFEGNVNKFVERYHFFERPFVARFIRFVPVSWHNHISMRVGVLGCPFRGECTKEFMRINDGMPCVENVAYHKPAFINVKRAVRTIGKRHTQQKEWLKGEEAAKAVDGYLSPPIIHYAASNSLLQHSSTYKSSQNISSCTVINNDHSDYPVWMVDLGTKRRISGIIIYTGTEQSFMYNVEKLTIFVSRRKLRHAIERTATHECNSISRINNGLKKSKLSFLCQKQMTGRYIYIEAWGVPSRLNYAVKAVLCEVAVYE